MDIFKRRLVALDVVLTGKSLRACGQTFNSQFPEGKDVAEWAEEKEAYCLSDNAYSRVFFDREANHLALTAESRPEVREKWDSDASSLAREMAEDFILKALKTQEGGEKMDMRELRQLQAERSALDRLLEQLPESSVIERMGLEARKKKVEKLLGTAAEQPNNEENGTKP